MPNLRVAYPDKETTGLSSNMDRIIEIAIVLAEVDWETGAIIQRLDHDQGLQDPGRRIATDAMAVHGITDAMVRGQHFDCRRARELLNAADICLAHNSEFDKGFVAQVVPEARSYIWGRTFHWIPWKKLSPSLRSTALQTLSNYFGCEQGVAHRALSDVETTMNLVSLPGIHGARAFQHYLLHKKIRRKGLAAEVVVLPVLSFRSQISW